MILLEVVILKKILFAFLMVVLFFCCDEFFYGVDSSFSSGFYLKEKEQHESSFVYFTLNPIRNS